MVREKIKKQNERVQSSIVTSNLRRLGIRSVKCSELSRRKQYQMALAR
jgi:hypothetical protein